MGMATVPEQLLNAEEFFRMPPPADDSKTELVRGKVVKVCRPGFQHGRCQGRVAGLLDRYGRTHHHGRAVVETGVVTERDPDTVRGPAVSYWSAERLPLDQEPELYPDVAADLCVEILSPGAPRARLRDKLREYFAANVRMVWVVDLEDRS